MPLPPRFLAKKLTGRSMGQIDTSKSFGLSAKPMALLAQFPGPVTLRPSPLKWSVLIVGNAFLGVTCGFLTSWLYLQVGVTIGVVGSAVGAVVGVLASSAGTFALLANRMWARLDGDGFETRNVWGRRQHRRWRDTDGFTTHWISFMRWTVYSDINRPRGRWEALNRAYMGGKSFLPDTYGFGAKGCAELMTAWRERALTHHGCEA